MHGDYSLQYCIVDLKVVKKADLQNFHHINKKVTMCWEKKKKYLLQCGRPGSHLWVGKIPCRREKATHCNILAWRILWTEEPGPL